MLVILSISNTVIKEDGSDSHLARHEGISSSGDNFLVGHYDYEIRTEKGIETEGQKKLTKW